jgi:hypothetical protein
MVRKLWCDDRADQLGSGLIEALSVILIGSLVKMMRQAVGQDLGQQERPPRPFFGYCVA